MSDNVVRKDVREIKYKVDGIERSVDLLLRASRKEVVEDLMINFFGKSFDRVRVFLAIDGEKSVNEVANSLKMRNQNVTKRVTELQDNDLIRLKITVGPKKTYEKTPKVVILRLEKELQEKFKEHFEAKEGEQLGTEQSGS